MAQINDWWSAQECCGSRQSLDPLRTHSKTKQTNFSDQDVPSRNGRRLVTVALWPVIVFQRGGWNILPHVYPIVPNERRRERNLIDVCYRKRASSSSQSARHTFINFLHRLSVGTDFLSWGKGERKKFQKWLNLLSGEYFLFRMKVFLYFNLSNSQAGSI